MKVAALEFRVSDKYFAIEMNKVKHFFEVEDIKKLPSLPEFVVGIVKYNNYVYPLISLKKAWGIEEEDSDMGIAIVYKGKEYAVLIDEIIKIDELEKKENFLIEVFEENGKIIGNLSLDFLKDLHIPTFKNHYIEKKDEIFNKENESFLFFKCNEEILGIETSIIKKVEEYQNSDIMILGESIVKVLDANKIYKKCEKENLIVLEDEKVAALPVGEIVDIHIIPKDKIMTSNEGVFNKYILYKGKDVKLFSTSYLKKFIAKYGVHIQKNNENKMYNEKTEVLVVNILGEKFAIRMKNITQIEEYEESHLTFANSNPYVKGIITTNEGATYILSFEKILGKKHIKNEESKIIVLKHHSDIKAIIVDEIEDLIYVDEENVIIANESENYIGGMIIYKDKLIPLLNINWPGSL